MRNPRNERVSSDIDSAKAERTCILSGGKAARDDFIRLAISPDGLVLPDVHARAPGRGAWIGVSRVDLEKALAKGKLKGALARAFKGAPLSIPDDLAERIEQALIRALTDRLGLELKSGKLLMGSDRIAQNAREGRVEWLAHAADASDDGSRKLDQAWRVGREAEGSGLRGTRLPLDRDTLSVALGRDNVVHLALTDRGAADRVATLLQRLLHFQGQADTSAAEMDDDNGQADAAPVTTN
ncbi:DUF448 domain-containing protein [Novosphingobium album (ex Hu et al. 2023)]|uniref:DUF448 domain-containing protein n=1 Tax=Novosphingobium album (ex Hu et al. 2023) TaxID=2930093 RepID=A0ABT0AZP4_9SPHN|nr:DUF448 domain-containing protein [Novosphingobium album (ex Hu et al. 2023)]MCJ2178113.1 DUF448 domain-containing protein [Novosphingobium album (ex Hu et al. 2023)]